MFAKLLFINIHPSSSQNILIYYIPVTETAQTALPSDSEHALGRPRVLHHRSWRVAEALSPVSLAPDSRADDPSPGSSERDAVSVRPHVDSGKGDLGSWFLQHMMFRSDESQCLHMIAMLLRL